MDKASSATIDQEVESLQTIEKQRIFLEEIGKLDQDVRHHSTNQLKAYGYDSDQHQLALQEMMQMDRDNLSRIELYFKIHGHPRLDDHGQKATNVPWMVIHHSSEDTQPRRQNFKYLYTAFKDGDLDDGALTFFLNRMYDFKYGYRIDWNRPFTAEEELDTLFKALDLYQKVYQVEDSLALLSN